MALIKATLSAQLEASFKRRPQSPAETAQDWANAYVAYASTALSTGTSLPVTASANLGILLGAFTGAFNAQDPSASAALIYSGVMGFWSAMVWVGGLAAGTTLFPGNPSLSTELGAIFSDTSEQSEGDKARKIADAFDTGAKLVMVNDIPFIQPAPPIIGPIS